jgi:hypothetical protein
VVIASAGNRVKTSGSSIKHVNQVVGNQAGIEIRYESLSGRKYRTLVTWGDAGAMHVGFHNL